MQLVGIEMLNIFGGSAYLDVDQLASHRGLDKTRFDNLLMKEKSVALPYEDPVSLGVNAAKPIIDALSDSEKDRIEMLITCTESSFDFGKSMSSYMHDYLGLNRNCRLFEIKSACYSGTTGLQVGINFVLSQVSPGAKVLVIATDISRFLVAEGGGVLSEGWSFAEPSSGAGAAAMLVSDRPYIFQVDVGANGYYGFEVMDTCRPVADSEAGDSDLSLLSYLDCLQQSFSEYQKRVPDANYLESFSYLAFHTPFGGMIKGAHRTMMRKMLKAKADVIESDFEERVFPGLIYCQRVGNIMGATTALSLVSTIEHGEFYSPKRVGCFSYGSGCCSEFFSGVVTAESQEYLKQFNIADKLDQRYPLSMDEYDALIKESTTVRFGTRNVKLDTGFLDGVRNSSDMPRLFLKEIKEYHRLYEWSQ
ncbi:MAG TPA: hydroxymethylglutaryl-CoA synthase family protein [Gammaproteobacteria bacterium]|nr:hydroxymethylglutaryl-CoA synthase family protein [Gammaproteobacteria bacterium]